MQTLIDRETDFDTSRPIPELPALAGWKEMPISVTEKTVEPLVAIGIFSEHPNLLASSVYADEHFNSPYTNGLKGSNIALFMREGVAERLDSAAELLPRGKYLMVMDAYRSLGVQGSLYAQYEAGVREEHPDWTDEQVSTETQKYVSVPSEDPTKPSPHNTGASVDVVIVEVDDEVQYEIEKIDAILRTLDDRNWEQAYTLAMRRDQLFRDNAKMLDFGTKFDFGGPEAALRFLEEKAKSEELSAKDEGALESRRLLYSVMTRAGMQPYGDEWWHYNDPASQMGAKIAGLDHAEYGAAKLSEENGIFAQMREQHHVNSVRLAKGEQWTPPRGFEKHYKLARLAVHGNNLKDVKHMMDSVAKIEPPKDEEAA